MDENEKNDNITDEKTEISPAGDIAAAENFEDIAKEPLSPKKSRAWVRFTAAACIAVLVFCLTGFGGFKLIFGGSELTKENLTAGKYLTFNVDTILDFIADDYAADTDTVTGRYAIVSVDGDVAIVHFPQRYLDSANQIAQQTYYQLYGYTSADKYFVASGTVKNASDEITDKYKTWYNSNAIILYQYGLIKDVANPDDVCVVEVDSTGLFGDTVCTVLSIVGAVLLAYAVAELILIKTKHYDDEITVEIFEDDESTGSTDDSVSDTDEAEAAPAEEKQETEDEP